MESTPRLFADDTAILIDANSTSELEIKLNEDLARVSIWMNKNQLTLNRVLLNTARNYKVLQGTTRCF